MQEQVHGNFSQQWRVVYNGAMNCFIFQNLDNKSDYHRLPVIRDIKLDLALYLKRLGASDDSLPKTIRQDTYKNMAKEILDGSDPIIWIRKGRWETAVLKITEEKEDNKINEVIEEFLKSDKNFKDFLKNK